MDCRLLGINVNIKFCSGGLTDAEHAVVSAGFDSHTEQQAAPHYKRESVKWLAFDERGGIRAVLTADMLWDWMYIDQLWVSQEARGAGLGRRLMQLAEGFARLQGLQGLWLWTQSWQAEGFYRQLGYSEFTRFDNFPKGHSRIGFRKKVT